MHELSLCQAIADTAVEHAGGRKLERILLQVGHFRQVVPETLQHCWAMRSADGPLAGCALDVDYVPATIDCEECGETTRLDEPLLRCGGCGGADVVLCSGNEFLIVSIDVAAEPAAPTETAPQTDTEES